MHFMYITDLSKSYHKIWIGIGRSRKICDCLLQSGASLQENIKSSILHFNRFCISRKVDHFCHCPSPQHPFVTQLLTRKLMIELLDMASNPDLHHPPSPEENEEVRTRQLHYVGITVIIRWQLLWVIHILWLRNVFLCKMSYGSYA